MAETVAYKYRAFISYSHADTGWAKWLHRGLEGFRIDKDLVGRETATGTIPKSLRPVFRDRDDFTAGHSLNDQTLAALDASHALIVICSPTSAKSAYVAEEVRLYKSRHPERPVIPLIVDGKPGDRDLECFPPSLRFKLDADGKATDEPAEVLAADAREEGDGKNLALAKVVAGLLGVSSDDIFRRAERERRRRGRVRTSVVAVLAFLAVAASSSAVYAWHQLKTNEAFLDATLERFAGLVNRSVSLSQNYSVPLSVTLGILKEAEGMLDVMATYGRDTPELRYRNAVMLRAFADNYRDLGQTKEWQQRVGDAYRLMRELVASNPSNVEWLYEKALVHERMGELLLGKSVAGNLSVSQENISGALHHYKARADILSHLVEVDPDNVQYESDLLTSWISLGDAMVAMGQLYDAEQMYQDGLALLERFGEVHPDNALRLSTCLERLGDVLIMMGNPPEALKAYQNSLAIRKRLTEANPRNAGWQYELSLSYAKTGETLFHQENLSEALKVYQKGLAIGERLTETDPDNAEWQKSLFDLYGNIGDLHKAQSNLNEAFGAYRKGLVIVERLTEADPHRIEWHRDLAASHANVASILEAKGEAVRALDEYRQAREIIALIKQQSPDNGMLLDDLALYDEQIANLENSEAPGNDAQ